MQGWNNGVDMVSNVFQSIQMVQDKVEESQKEYTWRVASLEYTDKALHSIGCPSLNLDSDELFVAVVEDYSLEIFECKLDDDVIGDRPVAFCETNQIVTICFPCPLAPMSAL